MAGVEYALLPPTCIKMNYFNDVHAFVRAVLSNEVPSIFFPRHLSALSLASTFLVKNFLSSLNYSVLSCNKLTGFT